MGTIAAILAKRKRMTNAGSLPWYASDEKMVIRASTDLSKS